MTQRNPADRALTRPTDHRHIPQHLDRITGIKDVLGSWATASGAIRGS